MGDVDPVLVALKHGSPRSVVLISERLERLAGVRRRIQHAESEARDNPAARRSSAAVLYVLDEHIELLVKALRDAQAEVFDTQRIEGIESSWQRLLSAQRLAQSS